MYHLHRHTQNTSPCSRLVYTLKTPFGTSGTKLPVESELSLRNALQLVGIGDENVMGARRT